MSRLSRSRMYEAQKKHLKSQRALSSILTLFGTGGVSLRYSSVRRVMRSMRSVMPTDSLPEKNWRNAFGSCELGAPFRQTPGDLHAASAAERFCDSGQSSASAQGAFARRP